MAKVVTRFPPSPTGKMHIGNVRTGLINYIFAKQNGGKMQFRIEDTDRKRYSDDWVQNIIETTKWLGWDTSKEYMGSQKQSERGEIYKKHLQKLLDEDKAYISKETEGESASVIRLRNLGQKVTFSDVIREEVTFDTSDLGDFIIAKNIDNAIYHFAVVVDDFEMGVTHVIRGEEHISNTPRQILIQEALGFTRPVYAHMPLILAQDRSKLSKRHGAISVDDFRTAGYLKEAILNYLILLGWSPQARGGANASEILTFDEMVEKFRLEDMQKSGAIWSYDKLKSINKVHLSKLSSEERSKYVREYVPEDFSSNLVNKITDIILDHANNGEEIRELVKSGELEFFVCEPSLSKDLLVGKSGASSDEIKTHLAKVIELLDNISTPFSAESVKGVLWSYASEIGRGKVLWPMRVALSGKEKSPDPFTLVSILGIDESKKRLNKAINALS